VCCGPIAQPAYTPSSTALPPSHNFLLSAGTCGEEQDSDDRIDMF
jgi:hypothetical protein